MAKWSFCHGIMVNPNGFTEVSCRQRERCAYYDVEFYKHHKHHLDDFEEMFPFAPCPHFIARHGAVKEEKSKEQSFVELLKG